MEAARGLGCYLGEVQSAIKEVRDKNEYITNMGRPDIARIKRDADVAAAEAERDTAIRRALAQRKVGGGEGTGRSGTRAGRDGFFGEAGRGTARSGREKGASSSVSKAPAGSRLTRPTRSRRNVMQQQVVAEQVKIQQIEKVGAGEGAGDRIAAPRERVDRDRSEGRKIERQRIQTLAEAEKSRLMAEAEGKASAIKPSRARPKPKSSSRRATPKPGR